MVGRSAGRRIIIEVCMNLTAFQFQDKETAIKADPYKHITIMTLYTSASKSEVFHGSHITPWPRGRLLLSA
jgi:hypothetical protein